MTRDRIFSPTPEKCDCCTSPLQSVMYDARTSAGVWATLCPSCFQIETDGRLGVGRAQKYERRADGEFALKEGGSK